MRFWLPNQTNGRPSRPPVRVPLDGELVGLRPAELQDLAGLLDGQERAGDRPTRYTPSGCGSKQCTVIAPCATVRQGTTPTNGVDDGSTSEAQPTRRRRRAAATALDVNAVVSFNVKAIRERRGMTQQPWPTGSPAHRPPAAAGVDLGDGAGLRRRAAPPVRRPRAVPAVAGVRRADRLLLPPAAGHRPASSWPTPAARSPSSTGSLLGTESQLDAVDERLGVDPDPEPRGRRRRARRAVRRRRRRRQLAPALPDLARGAAAGARAVVRHDRLDEVADFLGEFAREGQGLRPVGLPAIDGLREGDDDRRRHDEEE